MRNLVDLLMGKVAALFFRNFIQIEYPYAGSEPICGVLLDKLTVI